jgi:hypothetical protein
VSLTDCAAKMSRAGKDFFAAWESIHARWCDENARQFQETYVELLRSELKNMEIAIHHLDPLLQQLRNDCE